MKFTDIFIRRPVLAIVVSLLIVVLGLRSLFSLPINQYPRTQNAVVTISTTYFGADAQTVAGFITQPLESAIAQAQGIDYLSSSSSSGVSTITATLRLNYDANRALTEISTQVNSVKNQLPAQAQQPVLTVQTGQTTDAMYMGFYSDTLPTNNVTDFLIRVVKPKLDSINGVQTAELLGARQFALRAWLDASKMAAFGVTAADVSTALAANNYLAALGASKGQMVTVPLTAGTDLHSVEEFKQLAVKQGNGAIVRLEDVATVTLGSENYDFNVAFSGVRSVFIGIKVAPEANILDVAKRVRTAFPGVQSQLPAGLTGQIVYDSTEFINTSIDEVVKTLLEALLIVTVVIYLFLGSFRAVMVPVIAMPLSLIGTFFVMLMFGYSINLLTLLALVLAIGLVVDDAIIVVENVDRHMKEGKSTLESSLLAARELGGPILAMTVVLIAVYVPIGFQGGLTGALFTEFAFTLAGAVAVSGVVALTLSPMMCSRFFKAEQSEGRFVKFIDHQFERVRAGYLRLLHSLLNTWQVLIVMSVLLILCLGLMFKMSQSELAPEEDQGIVLSQVVGAPTATSDQMQTYADQVYQVAHSMPEYKQMFQITGVPTTNAGIGGVLLKDWADRNRSAKEIQKDLQAKWNQIAGARVAAFQFPALPGSSGLPVQFLITTTEPFENLNAIAQQVMDKARASGKFYFMDVDLKLDKPQATLEVDRDKITALGMTQQDVGQALGAALGGGYVNYFSIAGRSYKVIPQVQQTDRLNPDNLLDFYLRTPSGAMIPASTVAHITHSVVPEAINRFQQLNSATISGVAGVSQDEALSYLSGLVKEIAPSGYTVDYSGQSRQFRNESGGFVVTMIFAVIIVFLALAAQFESFRDPVIILVSVPLALFGAMIFIFWGYSSVNIYTQVGLVTLMGLISKHGILIVEFANQLRKKGLSKRAAIEEAAGERLRPILMTTAAMVFGVLPLVIASGAGAAGRHAMGLVIFTGLSIGTLFTLFVVPAMYVFISGKHEVEATTETADVIV
ncbi:MULTISPECIES: efflux RND transporter permease subunit [unclassified Undibacterium]|uniref:efflux RND transporter permease subunit n=1 Tax=unclassified Undibacterium TaxID=2630295 RepID=UPI002AC975C0|nr:MULTISPECIES: efflux RND transporter permease subunit [unclassified Undibacterium]MEB0139322.1 efflux RND transporter permease subunit [Undibacterium sp. CCC2.1]MEB0172166.1 efflux RND transporter permease subunit [Undibacterium sp. CCC1.1]MEB0176043.1 efflux RND transporter permease subunit [Undibacterium sp. CCC3.4]MEB0215355.1 efflux RND transporter permease subunit [Undibacterium sp. 5I2]WPX43430.1 efflux RND transporter permease subunit [Undibacterium sp. CCC3.4]